MWTIHREPLDFAPLVGAERFVVFHDGEPATNAIVCTAWATDADFASLWSGELAATPHLAFRWEMPPLSQGTWHCPFESVLLPDPSLHRPANPTSFAHHFATCTTSIAVFPNLSGDATLIVPRPEASWDAYPHLAAFLRLAPEPQVQALWQTIGQTLAGVSQPIWLNTAGAGVPWLHVRLDSQPKYIRFKPYRSTQ